MPVSQDVRAAILAAHGRDSAGAVASEFGVTRNTVVGIWNRRPRDTPAAVADTAAAPQEPKTAATAADVRLSGRNRAAWAVLLEAGAAGATEAEVWAALRPAAPERPSNNAFHALLSVLRAAVVPQGYTVVAVARRPARGRPTTRSARAERAASSPEASPSRWRIARVGEERPEPAPAPAAPEPDPAPPAAASAPSPAAAATPPAHSPGPALGPVEPEVVDLPAPSRFLPSLEPREPVGAAVFTGTARAVELLKAGCCRWPIGDLGDSFCFCCAPIDKPVIIGQTGVERPNSYCEIHREEARGRRQPAPPSLHKPSAQGFGLGQQLGRAPVKGRAA